MAVIEKVEILIPILWSENKIVIVFGIISWLSVLIAWLLWKYVLHQSS